MRFPSSWTDGRVVVTFVDAFHFLPNVEFDVTDCQDRGTLFPIGAKLAAIELHQSGCLIVFPHPNNWMVPQFRALWIFQVEGNTAMLAVLHKLMNAHPKHVGTVDSGSLLASEVR